MNTWRSSKYQFTPEERRPVDGVDYVALTYENRSIVLGDVVVPAGKVVTGVRFAHRDGHVLLEIRATDFDYVRGKLSNLESSFWISNEADFHSSKEIQIPNRSNPFERFNRMKLYIPQNSKKSYVRFGPSDFNSDLGQTTIPLIEADQLASSVPTPLSGIGLTYENDEAHTTGGAIAPKLIVYESPIGDPIFE